MSIPESIPSDLIAGDTWRWTRSLPNYPATTWTATVYFENKDCTFSGAGTPSGSDYSFSVAAATTGTYKPGRYQWRLRVTDGSVTLTVESGWLDVAANPAASGKRDVRSWARRTLDELEDMLNRFATTAMQSGSINGRSYSRADLPELRQWRTELKREVKTEEQGANAARGRNLKARVYRV